MTPTTLAVDDAVHRLATRKAIVRLVPLMMLIYFWAFVDRTNVSMAKAGLEADVGIGAAAYGLGAGLFFLSYAVLEVPSNLILHRLGARVWIARIAVTWGLISAAMMFVTNEVSFYVLRLLLGAAEAGLYPALLYLVTRWFAQQDRARVVGYLLVSAALATLLSFPLGGGILLLFEGVGGLHGWQWLFLLEGIPAILLGIYFFFRFPNTPEDAKWLTREEAHALTTRAVGEQAHSTFRDAVRVGFSNPVIMLVAVAYFLNQTAAYAVLFFVPSVVKGFGLDNPLMIGFVSSSVAVGAGLGAVAIPRVHAKIQRDLLVITVSVAATLAGVGLFMAVDPPIAKMVALSVGMFFITGLQAIYWSVAMARVSGLIAAATLAFINTIGLVGGFAGPYLFGLTEVWTGANNGGYIVVIGTMVLTAALLPLLVSALRRHTQPDRSAAKAGADPSITL